MFASLGDSFGNGFSVGHNLCAMARNEHAHEVISENYYFKGYKWSTADYRTQGRRSVLAYLSSYFDKIPYGHSNAMFFSWNGLIFPEYKLPLKHQLVSVIESYI